MFRMQRCEPEARRRCHRAPLIPRVRIGPNSLGRNTLLPSPNLQSEDKGFVSEVRVKSSQKTDVAHSGASCGLFVSGISTVTALAVISKTSPTWSPGQRCLPSSGARSCTSGRGCTTRRCACCRSLPPHPPSQGIPRSQTRDASPSEDPAGTVPVAPFIPP